MKRVGLYCGTFNPIHNGHKNIIDKSLRMFDKVIVAIGLNTDKDGSNTMYARQATLQELLPDVTVMAYQGLTVNLIKHLQEILVDSTITLIRGLRGSNDLDYETKTLRFNQDMMPDINVIMVLCDREYSHLSSSSIRALEKIDKGLGEGYTL